VRGTRTLWLQRRTTYIGADVEHCLTTRALVASLVLRPSRTSSFCFINQCLLMLTLWSCGRRGSVVQAQRQIHRVLLAACPSLNRIRGSSPLRTAALMPSEPHIRVSERCDDFCFGLQPDLGTEPRRVGQLPGRGRRSRRIRHDAVFQPHDADDNRLRRHRAGRSVCAQPGQSGGGHRAVLSRHHGCPPRDLGTRRPTPITLDHVVLVRCATVRRRYYVPPFVRRLGSEGPERRSRDEMALKVKGVVSSSMHAEQALSGSSRFEPLHVSHQAILRTAPAVSETQNVASQNSNTKPLKLCE